MYAIPAVEESRLVGLVTDATTTSRPWAQCAACGDIPSGIDAYFPEDGELPPAGALALCSSCPVATECLATALIHESRCAERDGWWGGLSPEAREDIAGRLGMQPASAEPDSQCPADIARRLRSENRTIPSIAAELGCTERTVYRYLGRTAA
jgi:hypothetical protein